MSDLFPLNPIVEAQNPAAATTAVMMLSHTAGLGDYPKDFNFCKDWTEEGEPKLIESTPLAYPPGTSW